MLGAGRHIIERTAPVILQAADLCAGEAAAQQRIFPRAFRDTAPARVACRVDHRCKVPVDAVGAGFRSRHMRGFLKQGIVKAAGFADRNGKHAAEAVDDVKANDQRDAQAALFHGNFLQGIVLARIVYHLAANKAGADVVFMEILLCG